MSDDERLAAVRARADRAVRAQLAEAARDDELRAVIVAELRSMGYTVTEPEPKP